jgi:hypothetical protein
VIDPVAITGNANKINEEHNIIQRVQMVHKQSLV